MEPQASLPKTIEKPTVLGVTVPSLRLAVTGALLMAGLIAIAAEALFFLEYNTTEARKTTEGKCRRMGSGLARQATRLLSKGQRQTFKEDLLRLQREDGIQRVLLCENTGLIDIAKGSLMKQPYGKVLLEEQAKRVEHSFANQHSEVRAFERDAIVAGVFYVPPIRDKSYVVYLQLDLKEPWSRARKEAIIESAVSCGIVILFTGLLWLWLNRVVTRRVNHIVTGANDLALGRVPLPPLSGEDELATIDHAMRSAHATVAGQALEVRLQKERYRLMMEALPVGLVTLRNQSVDFINRAGEALVKQMREQSSSPTALPAPVTEKIDQMLRAGIRQPQDIVLQRADSETPLHLELVVYQYDDVAGPAVKAVLNDVTERRMAEARRSALSHEIARTSEVEQRRIGQDLHDDICQRLAALKMNLQDFEEELAVQAPMLMNQADAMANRLSEAIQVTRALARGLSPVDIEAGGLAVALAALARDTQKVSGVQCQLDLIEPFPQLPQHVATQLYRISQESINNAIRHAAATTVKIRVQLATPDSLELRVSNDGEPWLASSTSDGMGLPIMRYRAESVRGVLEFDLAPEDATTAVRCTVPLSGESEPCP